MKPEDVIVCKFGGSSLADATQFEKVHKIVREDPRRRAVVVSAPGKRHPGDEKVTDLLIRCHQADGSERRAIFTEVRGRFEEIATAFDLLSDVRERLAVMEHRLMQRPAPSQDEVMSWGEHLTARLLSGALGARFIDAAEIIRFNIRGPFSPTSFALIRETLPRDQLCVIPGFYGADRQGQIRTFDRGGSDITGAIVAAGVKADLYENWTDVDGVYEADPRLVPQARPIPVLTYGELRELAYTGASVFHFDAMKPVKDAKIPIRIRNTNRPDHPGTLVTAERRDAGRGCVGIAGRSGFLVLRVEKDMMNDEIGFGRRVLNVLERRRVSFEHTATSTDGFCVVLRQADVEEPVALIEDVRTSVQADHVSMDRNLAVVTVVAAEEGSIHPLLPRLFWALEKHSVRTRFVSFGAIDWSLTVGVPADAYETATRALAHALFA